MSIHLGNHENTVEELLHQAIENLNTWTPDIFFEDLKTPTRSAFASIFAEPEAALVEAKVKLGQVKLREPRPFHIMNIEAPGGCWELGTQINPDLMKFVAPNGTTINMHTYRFIYLLLNAIVPDRNDVVRHLCNNRACIRPDHMLLGSQAQNILDEERRKYAGNTPQGRGQAINAHVPKHLQLRPDPWVEEPLARDEDTDIRQNLGEETRTKRS